LSNLILQEYDDDGMLKDTMKAYSILTALKQEGNRQCPETQEDKLGCACDKLLQQFHRFDEGIGIEGKWAGGSVTGVCRGWGSTKVSIDVLSRPYVLVKSC